MGMHPKAHRNPWMLYTILLCVLWLESTMAHTTILFITRLAGQPCLKKGMVIGRSLFTKRSLGYFHYISPSSLISWNCNTLNTRSQSWLSLYVPHVNTKLGKTAFCYKAPYIWNEVQKSLRLCSFISLREFSNLISCTTDFSCSDCNG